MKDGSRVTEVGSRKSEVRSESASFFGLRSSDFRLRTQFNSFQFRLNSIFMKDIKGIILIFCYVTGLALALLIIFSHDLLGDYLIPAVFAAIILGLILITISIYEVVKSDRIGVWEKVLWIIGILSVINLAGLVYIVLRRWRVVSV